MKESMQSSVSINDKLNSNFDKADIDKSVILNCLMYFDQMRFTPGITLAQAVKDSWAENPQRWEEMINSNPAFMTGNKPDVILNTILSDSEYSNLVIKASTLGESLDEFKSKAENGELLITTGGPVAVCLEDVSTREVFFTYRGTNTLEWLDNAEGFVQESSRLQREALKFYEKTMEEQGYDKGGYDVTVTGHSKGGNKAMFVALMSKYPPDRCVSYDGQGFSKEFCEKYSDLIEKMKDKICTIAADLDYVSPLGKDIAGNHIFFKTNEQGEENKESNNFGRALILASKFKIPNFALAHSPGSVFHVKDGKMELNTIVEERQKEPKELATMSNYIMENGSKEEQEKAFFAVMTMLQASKSKNSDIGAIIDTRGMCDIKELQKGLEVLRDYSKENGCDFCKNAFGIASGAVKGIGIVEKTFKSDKLQSSTIEELQKSAARTRRQMGPERMHALANNLKLQMEVREPLKALIEKNSDKGDTKEISKEISDKLDERIQIDDEFTR